MKMYYITRYEHNAVKPTEYYCGDGIWASKDIDRIKLRLYESEQQAWAIADNYMETNWHMVHIKT